MPGLIDALIVTHRGTTGTPPRPLTHYQSDGSNVPRKGDSITLGSVETYEVVSVTWHFKATKIPGDVPHYLDGVVIAVTQVT